MTFALMTKLNNLGVYFQEEGNVQMAVRCFREARSCFLEVHDSHNNGNPSQLATMSPPTCHEESFSQISEYASGTQEMNTLTSAFTNSVFTPGIPIDETTMSCFSSDGIRTSVVSSVLLFNFGVIYHLKGIEQRVFGAAKLAKAKSLYQRSLELLKAAGISFDCSVGTPMVDMLCMALFNNLAQVHFEQGEYKESRKRFDQLTCFCNALNPMKYSESNAGAVNTVHHCKSNMLLNALILGHSPVFASAA